MLKQLEKIFTVAMLFYTTTAILPFIAGDTSAVSQAEGNRLELLVQVAFYLVAFCFIALHWRTVMRGAWNAKWILLLAFVAVASTVWSQHPLFTLRRSAVMLATTAFGIYFGSRFTVHEQLRLLAWTCALMILTSFFMAFCLPQYGVDHLYSSGAWQGAFPQKNFLGRAMLLSVLVFYFARPVVAWWVRWVAIAGAMCLLVLSRSATGIVVLVVLVVALPLYRLVRHKLTFAIPVTMVAGFAAIGSGLLLYTILPSLLAALQRDSTLTGRTFLWHAMLVSIAKHPWLGYGFNAFWMSGGESSTVLSQISWVAKDPHNGFLGVTLDVGILGLSVLLAGYVVLWRRALGLVRTTTGVVPIWFCTYLAFIFFYNLTVGGFLVQNNIFWVLYTSTAVCVSLYAPVPASQPAINLDCPKEA
jgi:O-antigen ligase